MRQTRRRLTHSDFQKSKATGTLLRMARLKKGKKMNFVAAFMGIAPAYLSDLESGRRCLSKHHVKMYRAALAL